MTCKCKHSIQNHDGACKYTFCYCRYETFTADDGAMVEPLVTLA